MRPPKRNTLNFTLAVRSILKFRGSIQIDISKQNRSESAFRIPNRREDISTVMTYKYQQTSVVLSSTWSSLSPKINPEAFTTETPFSVGSLEIDWPFHATSFPKKFYMKEAVMDDKNFLRGARSKKRWLPRFCENQNKITRAIPIGQYWVFKTRKIECCSIFFRVTVVLRVLQVWSGHH